VGVRQISPVQRVATVNRSVRGRPRSLKAPSRGPAWERGIHSLGLVILATCFADLFIIIPSDWATGGASGDARRLG